MGGGTESNGINRQNYDSAMFDKVEREMGQSPTRTDVDVNDTVLGAAFEAHYKKGELPDNPLSKEPLGTLGDTTDTAGDPGESGHGQEAAKD